MSVRKETEWEQKAAVGRECRSAGWGREGLSEEGVARKRAPEDEEEGECKQVGRQSRPKVPRAEPRGAWEPGAS